MNILCDLDRIYSPSRSQEHRFEIAVQTLIESDTNPIEKFFLRVKAMILNSLNQVRSIVIKSIAGTEQAIVFLGKTFVVDKAYASLNEAIAGCRRDLDLGMAILIAPEANEFKVWVAIPNELIWQAA
jgi:hypothetical protein